MSENYQYTDCKYCGQSLMEGQIHNCRQMLLAKIAELIKEADRLKGALRQIANMHAIHPEETDYLMAQIARGALADRP